MLGHERSSRFAELCAFFLGGIANSNCPGYGPTDPSPDDSLHVKSVHSQTLVLDIHRYLDWEASEVSNLIVLAKRSFWS